MNEEQNKIAKKQIATIADYKKVFGTDQGKRVLAHICKECHILDSHYLDPNQSQFRDGERSFAVKILNILKYDVRQLLDLLEKEEKSDGEY